MARESYQNVVDLFSGFSECYFCVPIFFFVAVITLYTFPLSTAKNPSMALVVYSPPTLARFHEAEKNFTFAGKTLTISQDWNDGGVAAVVWDAAIVLSEYIEQHKDLVAGKKVIELGAGTGLVGMVAALLGGEVVVTDRDVALKHIDANVKNNVEVLSGTSLNIAKLNWGQDISHFEAPYHIIIGADIVYIEETFQELFKTLLDLSGNETVVLLSCRIRYERDNKFLKLLGTKFSVQKVLYNKDLDIVVYEARKLNPTQSNDEL